MHACMLDHGSMFCLDLYIPSGMYRFDVVGLVGQTSVHVSQNVYARDFLRHMLAYHVSVRWHIPDPYWTQWGPTWVRYLNLNHVLDYCGINVGYTGI